MTVVVWIVEGTWPACVDAARTQAADGAEIVLLHVSDEELPAIAHGAFAGLLGRGRPERDPGTRVEELAAEASQHLLRQAADRLGRPCTRVARTGRIEREVVAAAEDAHLLIVARDGDRSRLGPKSLSPHSRFVIDHAPCPILLLWPESPPALSSIPTPPTPPHPPHHH
ncbi:universal stress protein [Streptomyces sp. NPDC101225]|uniref:universal stress protein n=1 Tax=Streptomyces sp. NPDC101225 TaxID=3366135 RepID=UPI0038246FCB